MRPCELSNQRDWNGYRPGSGVKSMLMALLGVAPTDGRPRSRNPWSAQVGVDRGGEFGRRGCREVLVAAATELRDRLPCGSVGVSAEIDDVHRDRFGRVCALPDEIL